MINIDKSGIIYLLKLAALIGIIFLFWIYSAVELEKYFIPEPTSEYISQQPVEENTFYLELPDEKPIFLDAKEIFKKRQTMSWEKREFLFADLKKMELSFFREGGLYKSFPVAAKGKEGSFFEIPSGFYKIQSKAESHFSIIERTRVSWALHLFGNYFIYGSLYSVKGKSASPDSSVGSIKLRAQDAKELFSLVKIGLPVLVAGDMPQKGTKFKYWRKTNLPRHVPEVSAAAVLAADIETGEVLFEKNRNDAFPTASLTKLMTALVAKEHIATSTLLTVTPESLAIYGNSAALMKGETFSAGDLIYGLILPSSNDIAEMFERTKPNFIQLMNKKAKDIGLTETYYKDSNGLSKENIASVSDLFKLLQYIYLNQPQLLEITKTGNYVATSVNKKIRHDWKNINWPGGDARYLGGKAGFTDDSLQTMAGIWGVRLTEYGGRRISISTLGSRDRVRDIRAIIRYLEEEFIYGARSKEKQN